MERLLVNQKLTNDEAIAIRNIAFLVVNGSHKIEWYIETLKDCINPDNMSHALGYADFLTLNGELIFSRQPYNMYIRSLKKKNNRAILE